MYVFTRISSPKFPKGRKCSQPCVSGLHWAVQHTVEHRRNVKHFNPMSRSCQLKKKNLQTTVQCMRPCRGNAPALQLQYCTRHTHARTRTQWRRADVAGGRWWGGSSCSHGCIETPPAARHGGKVQDLMTSLLPVPFPGAGRSGVHAGAPIRTRHTLHTHTHNTRAHAQQHRHWQSSCRGQDTARQERRIETCCSRVARVRHHHVHPRPPPRPYLSHHHTTCV